MKKGIVVLALLGMVVSLWAFSDSYTVEGIYKKQSVPSGTLADMGSVTEDVHELYIPTQITPGKYRVELREDGELWEIEGQLDLYIKFSMSSPSGVDIKGILDVSPSIFGSEGTFTPDTDSDY
jgi:hypothetical protein